MIVAGGVEEAVGSYSKVAPVRSGEEIMMPKLRVSDLSPVASTLLASLACRAEENRRPDAMIRDDCAGEILARFDEQEVKPLRLSGTDQTYTMMRARQFDRYASAFLTSHPGGMIVDLGCGLDTRSARVDDGSRLGLGLDLPEVIEARRNLLPEGPREQLFVGSVLEPVWMEVVAAEKRPAIFVAEGVFPYLPEAGLRQMLTTLAGKFSNCELAFDALSRFSIWLHSMHPLIRKAGVHLAWGMDDGRELEAWTPRLHLLEVWNYFAQNEPRLGMSNLMRFIPPLANANYLVRYRLGDE